MSLPLFASIAALAIGPLIYQRSRSSLTATAVDAFALVGVGGVVVAHILPQSFAIAGWIVFPLALVGLFGPGLLCGSKLFAGQSATRITMPLALIGIALHALLDGIALIGDHGHDEGNLLALAVVLHRIPVGLGIWWLARPMYGQRAAIGLILAIAIFTCVGFVFGNSLIANASGSWVAMFQALIAGSLLHVILKHPPHVPRQAKQVSFPASRERLTSGLGGFAGLGLVAGLEGIHLGADHMAESATALSTFWALSLQSAPALLFAYVAVAFVHALFLDLKSLLGSGGTWSQSLRGTFAGLPIPICSCGVIPLYRSLIQKRVPPVAAMSFLVATPELGFAAIFLSWQLLGGPITLARAATAVALALLVGWLVGRRAPLVSEVLTQEEDRSKRPPFLQRLGTGLRYGFGDMVDNTGPWILVGLGLAAAVQPLLHAEEMARVPNWLEVPLFALIGMPLYVCASGTTPLVAVLIASGVSPGAAIAFLLTGPATNVTTFGVLAQLHGRGTALRFAAVVVGATIGLGYAVDAFLPGTARTVPTELHQHAATFVEIASLALLGLVFAISLLRQGTRGFVAQVISPHGESHDHDHHDHDHDHGSCGTTAGSHAH